MKQWVAAIAVALGGALLFFVLREAMAGTVTQKVIHPTWSGRDEHAGTTVSVYRTKMGHEWVYCAVAVTGANQTLPPAVDCIEPAVRAR